MRQEMDMRRIVTMAVVVAALVALALLVRRTSPRVASARAATTTDITFKEGVCNAPGSHCHNSFVKGDPTAFGARIIFSLPLTQGSTKIGREKGECVFLNRRSGQYFCDYNIRLLGGQVSVQGALPYNLNASASIPVTGGTGVYEGAYGHLTLLKDPNPPMRYQLHITTP